MFLNIESLALIAKPVVITVVFIVVALQFKIADLLSLKRKIEKDDSIIIGKTTRHQQEYRQNTQVKVPPLVDHDCAKHSPYNGKEWNHNNFVYAGLSSWYELAGKRAHGQDQPQFILPGFQIGHTLSGKRLDFTAELKLNNMIKNNQDLTISWWGLGHNGAMGIYFGLTKRFGGK